MKFSQRLWEAVRLSKTPNYQLAQRAGLHPNQLSKWMNEIEPVPVDDHRIQRLAELLNIPSEDLLEEGNP